MPSEDLHQPHDRLFKQVFGRKETAAAFLSAYLPTSVVSSADWARLELQPGSYIDSRLRHQESDLLFRLPMKGQDLFLYCLFEHQRTAEPWLHLRLLGYMVHIWQEVLKANSKLLRLPPILPLVLYQGPGRWNVSVRWLERLALPDEIARDLRRFQPDFEHLLVDLSQISADGLRGDVVGRLALGLMKAAAEDRLGPWLERAGPLLAELLRRNDVPGIIQTLLRYLLAVDSSINFDRVLAEADIEVRGQAMSIAQELIERGRQQGLEAGVLAGQIQTLEDLLNLPVTSLAELTAKPIEDLKHLAEELRRRLSNNRS
jgi:predicted transposase YdaD